MRHVTQRHFILMLIYFGIAVWLWVRPFTPLDIDIGGDQQSGLRDLDRPYVSGFWPSEPRPWQPDQGPALRWSRDTWHVTWPHAGTGWWKAQLRIDLSGRTPSQPATVRWEQPRVGQTELPAAPRRYMLLMRTTTHDSPTISASVNTFQVSNDSRALGIALTHIRLESLERTTPGLGFVWWLICLSWSIWVYRRIPAWGVATSTLSTLVYWAYPAWADLHSNVGIALTICAFVISVAVWYRNTHHWQHIHAIIMLCWGQLLALWSPWLISSDIAMHIRMLKQVLTGNMLFTAQLPCEAGAYISPYPPAVYVLLAPFAMLSGNADYLRLLLMSTAILLNGVAVWYMIHVLFAQPALVRYRHWFIAIACVNFPLFRATHIGEISNAVAHGIVTLAFISWLDSRRSIWVRIALTSVALLAHTGNSITFVMMLGILAAYRIVIQRNIAFSWRQLAVMSIPVIGTLFYYANFTHLIGQSPGYTGCPPDTTLLTRLSSLTHVLPVALIGMAVIGLNWVRGDAVVAALLAGFGAALISVVMLFVSTQTVRWGISIVPFLAIPIAFLFARLWKAGGAGRLLTLTSSMAWLWLTYADMWSRIISYLHD